MKETLILIYYYIKVALGTVLLLPFQFCVYLFFLLPRKFGKAIVNTTINIYFIVKFLFYISESVVGIILVTGLIAILAELSLPSYMQRIDTFITWKSIDELMDRHNYQQAEFLLETKAYLLKSNTSKSNVLEKTLAKCYICTGNYSKAEHTICRAYNGEDSLYVRLYDLYKKMGDKQKTGVILEKMNNRNKPEVFAIELANKEVESSPYTGILRLRRIINSPQYNKEQKFRVYLSLIQANYVYGNKDKTNDYVHQAMKYANSQDSYYYVTEMSDFCYQNGYIELAKEIAEQQIKDMGKNVDDDNIDKVLTKIRILRCRKTITDTDIDILSDCCKSLRKQISKNFLTMTSEQRDAFALQLNLPFHMADSLLNLNKTRKLIDLCLSNHVFRLSLLMRSKMMVKQIAMESGNHSRHLYDSLLISRKELYAIQDMNDWRNKLSTLRLKNTIRNLESEIGNEIISRDISVHDSYTEINLSKYLSKDEAIVFFVDNEEKVLAFIVDNNSTNIVHVGNIKELSKFKTFNIYQDDRISSLLWAGVESVIHDKKYVYYTPDKLFYDISIQALRYNDQCLVDKHKFILLSNPGDIAFVQQYIDKPIVPRSMAIWGGVDYSTYTFPNCAKDDTLHNTWTYMYSSKQEVDSLKGIFHEIQPTLFKGVEATKRSFMSFSGKDVELMHISTHGFSESPIYAIDTRHMHNCGLVFAGANCLNRKDECILRTEEIENLDLSSCKLISLSACETGLGSIDNSEGIFGLQRAFKLAGVKYILMSLRKVNDVITRDLMIAFYSNLKNKDNPDDALRKAQTKMREKYKSGSEWASFVLLH